MEERLAKAEARIMGEMPTTIFYLFLIFVFKILIIPSSNLFRSIGSAGKPSISCGVRGRIHQLWSTRGAVPVVCLYNIPNHVREVAFHGVRHGAAMALAVAQAHSSHDFFPMVF